MKAKKKKEEKEVSLLDTEGNLDVDKVRALVSHQYILVQGECILGLYAGENSRHIVLSYPVRIGRMQSQLSDKHTHLTLVPYDFIDVDFRLYKQAILADAPTPPELRDIYVEFLVNASKKGVALPEEVLQDPEEEEEETEQLEEPVIVAP